MLSLRLDPNGGLHLRDEPIPEAGPGEVLIKVLAVGLCGSDRHWVVDGRIGDSLISAPIVPGHEFAGIAQTGRHAGRLVALDPGIPCQRCGPCLGGAEHLCLDMRFAGQGGTDGALSEYVAWPERCLEPLGSDVSPAAAALVEPLAIALHALEVSGSLSGKTVAVIGAGPIGLLITMLAEADGAADIAATDLLAHRVAAAGSFGANRAELATESGAERAALLAGVAGAADGGPGYDVVFDASGDAAAVDTAIAVAGPGAQVVLVGIPSDDRTSFSAGTARRKELTLKLSRRSTASAFRRAAELVSAGTFDIERLVTLRVPLREASAAFESLIARDGLKVIVETSPAG